MKLKEFVAQSTDFFNELSKAIEDQGIRLKEVKERIPQFGKYRLIR